MKAPDKDNVHIVFRSIPSFDSKPLAKELRWRVTIAFPRAAGPDDRLEMTLTDWDEKPLDAGEFIFAGGRWNFAAGRASMAYADFIAGLREKAVWFVFPGRDPIPGTLAFG